MMLAKILICVATLSAGVFWIQMVSYWMGGHTGDQLVKRGVAGTAISLAVPMALIGLGLSLRDRVHEKSSRLSTWVFSLVALAVLLSPLAYVF